MSNSHSHNLRNKSIILLIMISSIIQLHGQIMGINLPYYANPSIYSDYPQPVSQLYNNNNYIQSSAAANPNNNRWLDQTFYNIYGDDYIKSNNRENGNLIQSFDVSNPSITPDFSYADLTLFNLIDPQSINIVNLPNSKQPKIDSLNLNQITQNANQIRQSSSNVSLNESLKNSMMDHKEAQSFQKHLLEMQNQLNSPNPQISVPNYNNYQIKSIQNSAYVPVNEQKSNLAFDNFFSQNLENTIKSRFDRFFAN